MLSLVHVPLSYLCGFMPAGYGHPSETYSNEWFICNIVDIELGQNPTDMTPWISYGKNDKVDVCVA